MLPTWYLNLIKWKYLSSLCVSKDRVGQASVTKPLKARGLRHKWFFNHFLSEQLTAHSRNVETWPCGHGAVVTMLAHSKCQSGSDTLHFCSHPSGKNCVWALSPSGLLCPEEKRGTWYGWELKAAVSKECWGTGSVLCTVLVAKTTKRCPSAGGCLLCEE